jgi:Hint module
MIRPLTDPSTGRMPPPFYSPNVALNCDGNQCSTINWGQQAHIPTFHDSPLLYYTRYRDCGNGIIEYDMAMHHFGQIASDIFTYFNTPWTGVRTSTFRDMMISNTAGALEHQFPMSSFGSSQLRNLDETGGFTTFTEDLQLDSDLYDFGFCIDTTKALPDVANTACDTNNPNIVPFVFKVREGGANAVANGLNVPYGLNYTVSANLCNLAAPVRLGSNGWGNPQDGALMINDRTGFSFQSKYIIHFCWEDKKTYFDSSVTADVINREFLPGDTISIKYTKAGKRIDDQLAMTFVHGTNDEYSSGSASFYAAKSRMRYGSTTNRRDGTVWTTNFIGNLKPSETYFSRKYIITDSLRNMEDVARPLSEETFEDVAGLNDLESGQMIKLWMDFASFGASIGSRSCDNPGTTTLACTGSSTPKAGYRPWFYITCGSTKATTSDPYHFAVFEKDDIFDGNFNKKPYLCTSETSSTRADWKLLGYFGNDCSGVGGRVYQPDFCPVVAPTTSVPTAAPIKPLPPGFCLSGKNTVEIKGKGTTFISQLNIGDEVLVSAGKYESVYSFGHRHESTDAEYLQLLPSHLEISMDHMIKIGANYIPASAVKIGDELETANGELVIVETITRIVRKGVYAPFTMSGTIVVSNIRVSSYVAFQDGHYLMIGRWNTLLSFHWLAHLSQAPHRVWTRIFGEGEETYTPLGMSNWIIVPHLIWGWYLEQNAVVMFILLLPTIVYLSLIYGVELLFTLDIR